MKDAETMFKKMVNFYVLGVVVCVVIIAFVTKLTLSEIDKEANLYKVKLGKKFILNKDTSTIIDYSSVMETFTLSNGIVLNASVIFNDTTQIK